MRAVAEAIRERLQANLGTTPVLMNVSPTQALPYCWLPTRTSTTRGRRSFETVAVFNIYYRAKGKAAVEALAKGADFLNGHTVNRFGDAVSIRYSISSRIGPDTDPNDSTVELITDTVTATFVSARNPSVMGSGP